MPQACSRSYMSVKTCKAGSGLLRVAGGGTLELLRDQLGEVVELVRGEPAGRRLASFEAEGDPTSQGLQLLGHRGQRVGLTAAAGRRRQVAEGLGEAVGQQAVEHVDLLRDR